MLSLFHHIIDSDIFFFIIEGNIFFNLRKKYYLTFIDILDESFVHHKFFFQLLSINYAFFSIFRIIDYFQIEK